MASTLDACLFWSLRLLGVPATPDSPTRVTEWALGEQMRLYSLVTRFYWNVLCTPANLFHTSVAKVAMLDVLVALWITSIDGEVPLYSCQENGGDPAGNKGEWVTRLMYEASKIDGPALVRAILDARICDPENFVKRTIQRMVTFTRVHTLKHLPSIKLATVERTNVGYMVSITDTLVTIDDHLCTLFKESKAPSLYIEVRAWPGRWHNAPYTTAIVSWAASTPVSSTSAMRAVITGGAVTLLLDYLCILLSLPVAHRFAADAVWTMMEEYALHTKIIPAMYKHIRASHVALSKPSARRPGSLEDGSDVEIKAVSKRILDLGSFTKHSVKLCDNAKKTAIRAVDDYVSETRPSIPAHLIRRFESFISTFKDTNGTYNGDDESFKVGAYRFKGPPAERKRQMGDFHSRGPTARSNFVIEGSLVYTTPAKALPNYT
ncbi:hypothetical protein FA13DRAFT_1794721 [Coprinellus micaceus]|uniref:Uncharacterized protein n=1 Tax=Coprinellus micaceus TaxID=71717 RepID=A0A4Y7T0V9_COPMI|nr:hypothetical protein FA13DRAFT_1794721 [Coprinellus micaceus]